jgi:cyclopropane-fatty-acyl-phospholipid synthase
MNLAVTAIAAAERLPLPDSALRFGIDRLVGRTSRVLMAGGVADRDFARGMEAFPIAVHTDAANEQHYELPQDFFALALGPRRKYSSCLYPAAETTLAEAEIAALEKTCAHARGPRRRAGRSLELGCGWGSLSLFMAERFPVRSRIVSVSNSASQRTLYRGAKPRAAACSKPHRDHRRHERHSQPGGTFDRIVSVEMFERMSNWH